jgi:hypothetical protein
VSDVYTRGVRFFQRHVVPIQFEFIPKSGGKPHYVVITSFLVSVRGTWLLLTAGHCVDDVQQNLDAGASLRCRLIDCAGQGAKYQVMVPFDWKGAVPSRVFKDREIDLGLVWVDDLTKRALAANNVEPLTEEAWDFDPPEDVEAYLLMGIPAELAKPSVPVTTITPVALLIEPALERPPELEETNVGRWYGHVATMQGGPSDITGMSGGPVLAVARDSGGRQRYWLFAMQSAWHRPTRAVAACPTRQHLRAIAEEFEKAARLLTEVEAEFEERGEPPQ